MDEVPINYSYKTKYEYFEKQNEKDCLIHSINNAFGRKVLTKQDVLEFIYRNAEQMYAKLCGSGKDAGPIVDNYLSSTMREKNTMFSANIIWRAAVESGNVKRIIKIPGFSSKYLYLSEAKESDMATLFPEWSRKKPIVVLGATSSGSNHAIAVRDGLIYDSEKKAPMALTLENLRRSLSEIHAAYAFD